MKWVQRGGSVPSSKQEVIGYRSTMAANEIQNALDKYAVRVVNTFEVEGGLTADEHVVYVVYEEDLDDRS